MTIIRFGSKKNNITRPLCLTIGNFDGVHFGHQQVILQLKETAKKNNLATGLITFLPHPALFFKKQQNFLLQTFKQKITILQQFNLDYLIILKFDKHLANLSHNSFIKKILLQYCHANTMVVGYDFTFGKNRLGNLESLERNHILAKQVDCQKQQEVIFSSSLARKFISEGDIQKANQILTRHFSITGKVLLGRQIASQIGFPTLNVVPNAHIILPKFGVYKTETTFVFNQQKITLPSITNFGIKPTVSNNQQPLFETHLFNWQGDLYNQQVEVRFLEFLRPEKKFSSLLELQQQIKQDIKLAF